MSSDRPARIPLPKAVLLDLDDTILDDSGNVVHCWRDACAVCPSDLAISPETLFEAIEQARDWYWSDRERHRRGRLDLDAAAREVVTLALERLGIVNPDVAAAVAGHYRRQRDEGIRPIPGAIDTVRWLKQSGCRLALVTNGAAAMQRRKLSRFDLADLFDAVLIEGELGYGKPDARVYERALEALSVTAPDAWMVGDNFEWDVEHPQRMGMAGIWIDVRGSGLPADARCRPARVIRALTELRDHSNANRS